MNALYWVRNDLRINDNDALSAFFKVRQSGLAVWSPTKTYQRARLFRKNFIDENLNEFQKNLHSIGVNFEQTSDSILNFIIKHSSTIKAVYFSTMHSHDELVEENDIKKYCLEVGINVFIFDQNTLIKEKDLPFDLKNMPLIFTDFRKKCELNLKIDSPTKLFEQINRDSKALVRLNDFIWNTQAIKTYKETRNGMIEFNDSSKFSPWLSIGALSARTIYSEIKNYEKIHGANESTYWLFFELLWRDYFKFLSKKFGNKIFLRTGITHSKTKEINFNKNLFFSWCKGETTEPFINANMKELNATGFMSNRGRQNVASFLIHDLKLPWTWGARYFEEILIDYDPDSNWGNWLYLSGNGTDPRSRVFNIKKQALDYDPLGLYQEKWNLSGEKK